MTKKHFEAIAALIKRHNDILKASPPRELGYRDGFHSGAREELNAISDDLADLFESENPRFDRDQFLTACGF